MFTWNSVFGKYSERPRVNGFSGGGVAFILAIVASAALVTGWIMCRIVGTRLLFGLPLAVIGAIAGVFLLDQILVVSALFGAIHAEAKLIIDLVCSATLGAAIAVLPLQLLSGRNKDRTRE